MTFQLFGHIRRSTGRHAADPEIPAPRGVLHARALPDQGAVGLFRGDTLVKLIDPLGVGRLRAELRDAVFELAEAAQ